MRMFFSEFGSMESSAVGCSSRTSSPTV